MSSFVEFAKHSLFIRAEQVVGFHKAHYAPDKMRLVVLGGQSLDELAMMAAECFDPLPARPSAAAAAKQAPTGGGFTTGLSKPAEEGKPPAFPWAPPPPAAAEPAAEQQQPPPPPPAAVGAGRPPFDTASLGMVYSAAVR